MIDERSYAVKCTDYDFWWITGNVMRVALSDLHHFDSDLKFARPHFVELLVSLYVAHKL